MCLLHLKSKNSLLKEVFMQVISSNYGKNESDFQLPKRAAKCTSCLDIRRESQTSCPTQQNSNLSYIIKLYPTGEIVLVLASRNLQSKPPSSRYGARLSTGVSSHGRVKIRRAVSARVISPSKPVMLTLTTQDILEDRVFNRHLASFLAYARKIAASTFRDYVKVVDLQQRGTLHSHILLFERIPTDSFGKLRTLWVDKYEFGGGAFDAKSLKGNSNLAVNYLSHAAAYLARDYDDVRIGRNGKPYVRTAFKGNAYSISASLRKGALPFQFDALPLSDQRVHGLAKTLNWVPDGYAAYRHFDSFGDAKQHLASFGITA
jgi:hypothetical protein